VGWPTEGGGGFPLGRSAMGWTVFVVKGISGEIESGERKKLCGGGLYTDLKKVEKKNRVVGVDLSLSETPEMAATACRKNPEFIISMGGEEGRRGRLQDLCGEGRKSSFCAAY